MPKKKFINLKVDLLNENASIEAVKQADPDIIFHLAGENRNKIQNQFINNNFKLTRDLVNLIKKNGFSKVKYRNLSGGISAIHSGWKI